LHRNHKLNYKEAISVDGQEVEKGRIERTVPIRFSEECFDMGEDTGMPVNLGYDVPFKFTGKIDKWVPPRLM
jgi:hypothetical protein